MLRVLVNNYDWMKGFSFLNFIRDVGKHITVNYMMAKDSVKKRFDRRCRRNVVYRIHLSIDSRIRLFIICIKNNKCTLQMGGSRPMGKYYDGNRIGTKNECRGRSQSLCNDLSVNHKSRWYKIWKIRRWKHLVGLQIELQHINFTSIG